MNKIAAIVITYNRKDCLIKCLEAIRRQTLPPEIIYIVDNHSTKDTAEMLLANQIISTLPDMNASTDVVIHSQARSLNKSNPVISIKYVYKAENVGSAGGFCTGMEMAYEGGNEWLWMMDDDGLPVEDGLEQLLDGAKKYKLDYANALVVSIEDRNSLSFGLEKGKTNIDDYKNVDVIFNKANPWNGTLINRSVPEKIGFIKKEMFIWGEEVEYRARTLKNGFRIGTIRKSIHYHPKNKGEIVSVFPFIKERLKIVIKPSNLSHYYYRNLGYNNYTYSKIDFYKTILKYIIYFTLRFDYNECVKFIILYILGSKNKF
jgi:rhamnopyranosyl-N-acetylglucosaminyl-diphospho-decaprenol beta-1,3/1,4-galactofuranosyltransferase